MNFKRRFYQAEEGGAGAGAGAPSPAPAPAPAPSPAGDPPSNPDWRLGLPPELATHPSLKDIKDINGLVKTYVSAQSMIGERIPIPKEADSADVWKDVMMKLGAPGEAAKYNIPEVSMPEGLQKDPKLDSWAKDLFAKANLTQTQAAEVYKEYVAKSLDDYTQAEAARAAAATAKIESLKNEWGGKFEGNVSMAKQAIEAFGGPELKQFMNQSGFGDDPAMIKAFHKIGVAMGEDKGFREALEGQAFSVGGVAAKAEIARLQGDTQFMNSYTKREDPGHMAAKQKMDMLWKAAYPGTQQAQS